MGDDSHTDVGTKTDMTGFNLLFQENDDHIQILGVKIHALAKEVIASVETSTRASDSC
jgi:hypothetical protein